MREDIHKAVALLKKICRPGYFGKVTFTISNGTIQPTAKEEKATKI